MPHIPAEANAIARSILRGELSIIDGSRELWRLGSWWVQHEEEEGWAGEHDDTFDVFFEVCCETQHFPHPEVRCHWNKEALQVKDREMAEYEANHRDAVFAGCHRLIEKFNQGS